MSARIGIIVGVLIALFVGVMSFSGINTVNEGYRGVKKVFGNVQEVALEPGLYFYNPFTTSIEEIEVRTQRFENQTSTYTKDVQEAGITYVLNFSLSPQSVVDIYSTVGRDYEKVLIPQAVDGAVKDVLGQWNAVELINKRDAAREAIEGKIRSTLAKRGLLVERLELSNISYRKEFENAVEDKVIAIQQAEASVNKTVRIEEEAKQKIIAAQAEAESIRILGVALAENKDLVSLKAVEKWDGKLPVYMMGDSVPLVQVPTK